MKKKQIFNILSLDPSEAPYIVIVHKANPRQIIQNSYIEEKKPSGPEAGRPPIHQETTDEMLMVNQPKRGQFL